MDNNDLDFLIYLNPCEVFAYLTICINGLGYTPTKQVNNQLRLVFKLLDGGYQRLTNVVPKKLIFENQYK